MHYIVELKIKTDTTYPPIAQLVEQWTVAFTDD